VPDQKTGCFHAFCHRNYYEYDSVNIAIFKDRLEIRNPGGLFGGLTIEQIKRDMVSKRRNEIIADLFHRVHFVEKWGRGIDLILSEEPTADFKEVADIFITIFKRKNYEAADSVMNHKVSYNTGKKTSKKTGKKSADLVINLITENPYISIKELAESTGLSINGVRYHLDNLKQKGMLKRVGPDKGGYWHIIK
jgi:ATP-dependent DNA helicase RecG